jgi:hypothetical protein
MSSSSITILKSVSLTTDGRYSLNVTIQNSTKIQKELFVIEKSSSSQDSDKYSRVASRLDIYKLKKFRTSSDKEYLSSAMSYVTDNIVDLEASWPYILQLLTELVEYYNTVIPDILGKEEIITIP